MSVAGAQLVRMGIAAVALTIAAGCGANTRAPAVSQPPIGGPIPEVAAFTQHGMCGINAPRATVQQPRELPSAAISADLLWYPGLNAHACRTYRTHLSERAADRLLAALRAAPAPLPGEVYHCPMDDGSFVEIWFNEVRGSASIQIDLSGCRFYLPTDRAVLGAWPNVGPEVVTH